MVKIKKKHCLVISAVLVFLVILSFAGAFSNELKIRYYSETTGKIDSEIRLAVLTDLHSSVYGEGQHALLSALDRQSPDVILLVGDIADDHVPHDGTKQLLEVIGKKYPCYYVSGNHEYRSDDIGGIKEMIRSYDVTILEGDTAEIEIGGQRLSICGVDDPRLGEMKWENQLVSCFEAKDSEAYSVLLSHRPERVDEYDKYDFDLILCGHAHGGQVRIPFFLNGLLAPNQGFFPKYAGGRYSLENSVMIVSRGLAKNVVPRVFNRPELVIVDIMPES